MIENINWYPGHMKKARELIAENLKLVDTVVEMIDARIPVSSRNPVLGEIIGRKDRIIVLSKADLADDKYNALWAERLSEGVLRALVVNCSSGEGSGAMLRLLSELRDRKNEGKERKKPLRIMIVGIPNVGKSSLINRLTGKKGAITGNKPGVTRGKQWLALGDDIMLLDTPGVLWPKFEDPEVGLNLAFCGSIKDETLDLSELGLELISRLSDLAPELLSARYKLEGIEETPLQTMEAIALKRGFILPGKRIDYERTGRTVIDEFRAGTIGRITLER